MLQVSQIFFYNVQGTFQTKTKPNFLIIYQYQAFHLWRKYIFNGFCKKNFFHNFFLDFRVSVQNV
jgi:hypothetical protein